MLSWTARAVMFGAGDSFPLFITGLESSVENGQSYLSAVSANGGTILRYAVGAGGTLVAQAVLPLPPGHAVAGGLAEVDLGGQTYLVALPEPSAFMPGLTLTDSDGGGNLSLSGAAPGAASVAGIDIAGASYIFVAYGDSGAVDSYMRDTSGQYALSVSSAAAPGGAGAGFDQLTVAASGGTSYLVAASTGDDSLRSYRIDPGGSLVEIDRDGAPLGLGIDVPSATGWTVVDGETFIVQAGAGSSSLSVLRLESDGQLTATDHVVDTLSTRFHSVTALDIVVDGGRSYVLAGGADGGISVLLLLPGGRLFHLATIVDSAAMSLASVSAIAATASGGVLQVFAASGSEAGFTHLTLTPGITGAIVTGTAANETLSGTALVDILLDGAGKDSLTGGGGADVFVMDYDGAEDTITDFNPAMDRLDLSGWTLLRSADQLTVTPTAFGATITYRGEVLHVHSSQGTQLTLADFAVGGVVNLDHFQTGFVDGVDTEGTVAGEALVGTALKDRLYGDGGNDTLDGRGGADTLDGGVGLDIADFSWSADPVTASLIDPGLNAGAARDVIFFSIEGLIGGAAADLLVGNGANNDLLGNGGSDRLEGGGGNDTLNGGAGGDVLDGGAGTDTVSYAGSTGGLRVDLMFAGINTNVAAGDSYVSIENLTGSQGSDNLRGTTGANLIQGMVNVDFIFGRAGDDTLEGGVGDDVLLGGVGADVLNGGTNRDRAQYSESLTALVIDLMNPGLNTGEAAGDSYISIEDLAGGFGADTISGDTGANRLFGRDGADRLFGRAGDDALNGGAGSDRLDGGVGNDMLRGGQSADTFVFTAGADIAEDFTAAHSDLIAIDRALLGGAALTGAEIVTTYATVVGGMVVFDFGSGNTLTLQTLATTAGLDAYVFSF